MSKIALALKINLSEIDMARVFQGKKGQYLDATIFVDMAELDQYGNSGMITQDVSKEEKAQKVQGKILGNGKVFWVEGGQAPQQAGQQARGGFQAPVQNKGFQQAQQPVTTQQQGGFAQQKAPTNQGGFAPQGGYPQDNAPSY